MTGLCSVAEPALLGAGDLCNLSSLYYEAMRLV